MKNITYIAAFTAMLVYAVSCNPNQQGAPINTQEESTEQIQKNSTDDDLEGIGKFHNIELAATLDLAIAEKGKGVYDLKCSACHRLTDEKLVGPGWKGVTKRRKPAWILNFITNPDEMLDKDKTAQGLLEICLVRMPNQQVTEQDAFAVLEFMRQNDGIK
jgi:hypothetical protein